MGNIEIAWPEKVDILKSGLYACNTPTDLEWNGGVIPEGASIHFNEKNIVCFEVDIGADIKVNGKKLAVGLWKFENGKLLESSKSKCK